MKKKYYAFYICPKTEYLGLNTWVPRSLEDWNGVSLDHSDGNIVILDFLKYPELKHARQKHLGSRWCLVRLVASEGYEILTHPTFSVKKVVHIFFEKHNLHDASLRIARVVKVLRNGTDVTKEEL